MRIAAQGRRDEFEACYESTDNSKKRSQGFRVQRSGFRNGPTAYRLPPTAYRFRRRGVLILVVLSLLFLFVLIAITFVLVATRQLAASKQYAHTAITGDPPQALLNEAMMQVLHRRYEHLRFVGHFA